MKEGLNTNYNKEGMSQVYTTGLATPYSTIGGGAGQLVSDVGTE